MLPRGELQFPGPDDHLARHAVSVGTRNAVLDGSVPERLDEHGDERRAAAADGTRYAEQGGVHRQNEADLREERLHLPPLPVRKRMAAFADDDAFADRNGRIGNDAQMVRAGGEHPLAVVERNARGHRNDDLIRQLFPDGRKHRLDLIGFHGDDDQIGELRDRRRVVESPEALRLRVAPQFRPVARARTDVAGLHGPRADKPARHGLRHISESKKSDFHISLV